MTDLASALLAWFGANKRRMPWRRKRPRAYHVWVSEVMLQQTQVDTVIPYFHRFVERFPTIRALAGADPQALLKTWEGLGYYSRARNLQKAAQQIMAEHGGRLPRSSEVLQMLPGVGPYIAAAVASIVGGEQVPVVDGNVLRVAARLFGIADDIRKPATRKVVATALQPHVPAGAPGDFNQAIMELGALVCRPGMPDCPACPLRARCVAHAERRTAELPVKSKRKPTPHHNIGVGVVWRRGKVLIGRRRDDQMLGGLWEFPGGKQEPGEPITETVVREIREETGLTVAPGETIGSVNHAYSHFSITMTAIHCTAIAGRTRPASAAELRWVSPGQLSDYPFPKANRRILDLLAAPTGANPESATEGD